MTAFLALGRLTSHPSLKPHLRTRFRDPQPTVNWAAEPPNRTIFSCAIIGFIARRTNVRKRWLRSSFPGLQLTENRLGRRQCPGPLFVAGLESWPGGCAHPPGSRRAAGYGSSANHPPGGPKPSPSVRQVGGPGRWHGLCAGVQPDRLRLDIGQTAHLANNDLICSEVSSWTTSGWQTATRNAKGTVWSNAGPFLRAQTPHEQRMK